MSRKRRRYRDNSRKRSHTEAGAAKHSQHNLPRSGYREYLERCEFSGREPEDFTGFLAYARRWRTEYGPAKDQGDFARMRELEELLCV